jgi:hypothetical protein
LWFLSSPALCVNRRETGGWSEPNRELALCGSFCRRGLATKAFRAVITPVEPCYPDPTQLSLLVTRILPTNLRYHIVVDRSVGHMLGSWIDGAIHYTVHIVSTSPMAIVAVLAVSLKTHVEDRVCRGTRGSTVAFWDAICQAYDRTLGISLFFVPQLRVH